jgi:hypothetical protein
MPEHAFCSPQKVSRFTLGRSPGFGGDNLTSVGRFTFPSATAEWSIEATALAYSGGTAPDLHRTSLLSPPWAPKASQVVSPGLLAGQATRRGEIDDVGLAEHVQCKDARYTGTLAPPHLLDGKLTGPLTSSVDRAGSWSG